jgi:hypothetical protein
MEPGEPQAPTVVRTRIPDITLGDVGSLTHELTPHVSGSQLRQGILVSTRPGSPDLCLLLHALQ